jgi:hypothetical protein
VVAHVALTELAGGPPLPREVALVATLGSPHDGTDLATAAAAIGATEGGARFLDELGAELDLGLDPSSPSIAQMAESSPLMAELAGAPLASGPELLSIGARGDLTVPATHTYLPGSTHQTIDLAGPDAHTELPGDPATTRELALALAGAGPGCTSAGDELVDLAVGEGLSYGEDLLGLGLAVATS